MAKPLVDDELWKLIQPLLPVPMPRRWRYPGRKRLQNRRALTGILFVLKSGILGNVAPGDGVWLGDDLLASSSRLAGSWSWQNRHEMFLAKLREADQIDWSRAVVDSASIRAVGGGGKTGPNLTDRRKPEQAPPDYRRPRDPSGRHLDGR
jgi:hypothetical protein